MKRFIVVGQNRRMVCTFWLDVEQESEVYAIVNKVFKANAWGRPHISTPVSMVETQAVNVASNNNEICRLLGIEDMGA